LTQPVTQILEAVQRGELNAAESLLPLVYNELRRLAAQRLAKESPGQTLQATALVHEAYIRLVGSSPDTNWDHRGHFFAAAAEAMRRILVENARRKQSLKRGGGIERVDLSDGDVAITVPFEEVVALNDAIDWLEKDSPVGAQLVKLRCFAGLTLEEAALALDISRATASKHWAYARAWLYRQLHSVDDTPDSSGPGAREASS